MLNHLSRTKARGQYLLAQVADIRRATVLARAARGVLRNDRPLPTYWWNSTPNFGDVLSPVTLNYVSGANPVYVGANTKGKVLALGSILDKARPTDVIWGTGAIRTGPLDLRHSRILAVRGPRTKNQVIGDVPDVFGDPAILLPLIYTPRPTTRTEIGLIPHVVDQQAVATSDPKVKTINLDTGDWRSVIDQICSCDVAISSSLHGIVVAEAYGVPAVWFEASDRVIGGGFKFFDYYEGSGRTIAGPAQWRGSVFEIAKLAAAPPPLDPRPLIAAWQ